MYSRQIPSQNPLGENDWRQWWETTKLVGLSFRVVVIFILQAVGKKLGKEEDEHIVASDSQLDAKLELFK